MGLTEAIGEGIFLEKAVIQILDVSEQFKEPKKIGPVDPNGKKDTEFAGVLKAYQTMEELNGYSAAMAALDASNNAIPINEETGELTRTLFQYGDIQDVKVRQFEVQFNPSSLNISGYGGGIVTKTKYAEKAGEKGGGSLAYGEADTHIELSVQLFFDQTIASEAFLGDATTINVSRAADQIASNISQSKRPSVQQEVEAFLAVVRNRYTRGITFAWGNMMYSGQVVSTGAKYTMFNPSGIPIRAIVQLRMTLADKEVAPGNLGYWKEMYRAAFEDSNQSYNTWTNSIGNLINTTT